MNFQQTLNFLTVEFVNSLHKFVKVHGKSFTTSKKSFVDTISALFQFQNSQFSSQYREDSENSEISQVPQTKQQVKTSEEDTQIKMEENFSHEIKQNQNSDETTYIETNDDHFYRLEPNQDSESQLEFFSKENRKFEQEHDSERQIPNDCHVCKQHKVKHHFSKQERIKILKYALQHGRYKTCVKFQISNRTILNWLSQTEGFEQLKKTVKHSLFDMGMEKLLNAWIQQQFNKGKNINKMEIYLKAINLSQMQNFQASDGWFRNYLKRNPESKRLYKLMNQNLKQSQVHARYGL